MTAGYRRARREEGPQDEALCVRPPRRWRLSGSGDKARPTKETTKLWREARRDVVRVLELHDRGFSAETIAASVGLTVGFVSLVLEHADEFREEAEGGGGVR